MSKERELNKKLRKLRNVGSVDLLSLQDLNVEVNLEEVSGWTMDQVELADDWACKRIWNDHSGSKKKVVVPERPSFLRERQMAVTETVADQVAKAYTHNQGVAEWATNLLEGADDLSADTVRQLCTLAGE